jgi:predicted Rossmann fold nucleotide-binding protein DprA/Smf involved in DNA uptake
VERVAIVGSRGYPDEGKEDVFSYVHELPSNSVVVSGGAEGPDTWAERAAKRRGLLVVVYRADWSLYGKAAGFIRNGQIVANCDRVVAFWDGHSRGTKNTIDIANRQGKPVEVYCPDEVEA